MIRLLSLLVVLAGPVAAQSTIAVRAAEHPDYSRLIVPLPEDVSWVLASDGRTTTVTFPGLRTDFDLADVFNRMPRTRIVAVAGRNTALGAALELTLTCSCDVVAERIGSRFLAIDVSRESTAGNAPASRRLLNPFAAAPKEAPKADHEEHVGDEAPTDPAHQKAQPEDKMASQADHTAPAMQPEARQDAHGADDDHDMGHEDADMAAHAEDAAPPPEMTPQARSPLDQIRRELGDQLANAAAEGLLDLAEPMDDVPHAEMDAAAHDQMAMSAETEHDEAAHGVEAHAVEGGTSDTGLEELLANSQIETRLPLEGNRTGPSAQVKTMTCTSDAVLNTARWSNGKPILDEIGALRRAVVSDYGTIDGSAVADLAKLYILNGFGREAKAVLSLVSPHQRDSALLRELADVVEGRPVPEGGVLAGSGDCAGRISMWRVVAGLEPLDQETERGAVILKAFAELPPELRRIAGEGMAGRSLDAGDDGAASRVLEILDRTPGPRTPQENLTRAEFATEVGEHERAAPLLEDLEQDNSAQRREAMMLRARTLLEDESDVPADLVEDLAIEQRLTRGTDIAIDLSVLMARLQSRRGQPFEAMALLDQPDLIRNEAVPQTARIVLDEVDPATLADGDYARLVMQNAKFLGKDRESEALRQRFARGLNARGLPNLALDLLERSRALPDADARMLRAETMLALDRPGDALDALGDLQLEAAARLRSDAHLRLGSVDSAFLSLASLAPSDAQRSKFAVLSSNWDQVDLAALSGSMRDFASSMTMKPDDEDTKADPDLQRPDRDTQGPQAAGDALSPDPADAVAVPPAARLLTPGAGAAASPGNEASAAQLQGTADGGAQDIGGPDGTPDANAATRLAARQPQPSLKQLQGQLAAATGLRGSATSLDAELDR